MLERGRQRQIKKVPGVLKTARVLFWSVSFWNFSSPSSHWGGAPITISAPATELGLKIVRGLRSPLPLNASTYCIARALLVQHALVPCLQKEKRGGKKRVLQEDTGAIAVLDAAPAQMRGVRSLGAAENPAANPRVGVLRLPRGLPLRLLVAAAVVTRRQRRGSFRPGRFRLGGGTMEDRRHLEHLGRVCVE